MQVMKRRKDTKEMNGMQSAGLRRGLWLCALCGAAVCAAFGGTGDSAGGHAGRMTLPAGAWCDGRTLKVTGSPDAAGGRFAQLPIDLADYAGAEVRFSIRAKGRAVSKPAKHWKGVKFMLKFRDAEFGDFLYPQARMPSGDFDGTYSFSAGLYRVQPKDAVLCLGLEGASGEVEFDLSSLTVEKRLGELFRNYSYRVGYPDRVANRSQLRGCMVSADVTEKDLADLAAWGATMFRYQITPTSHSYYPKGDTEDEQVEDFNRSLAARLDCLADRVVPWARRFGLKVAVDMHMFPEKTIYTGPKSYTAFVEGWKRVAKRLKGNTDVIYGYDLINEPVPNPEHSRWNYWTLQEECARQIRMIDPDVTLIATSSWGGNRSFDALDALPFDNVIYTAHVYDPINYACQGLMLSAHPERAKRVSLPDDFEAYIRQAVRWVRRFQLQHGCRIYIGEFSAVMWADRAEEYIATCAKVFNEYGWDWTYHAFRESEVWSVEHEAAPCRAFPPPRELRRPSADNPRKRALLGALAAPRR